MTWLKWVGTLLLLLAGLTWVFPTSFSSVTGYSLMSGLTLATVLGVVAIAIAVWDLYEMTMKK